LLICWRNRGIFKGPMLHADLLVRGHRGAGGVTPAFVGRCGGFYYGMGTEKQEKISPDDFERVLSALFFRWKRPANSSLPCNSPFVRQYVMVSTSFVRVGLTSCDDRV
jgi:hypothetical protein